MTATLDAAEETLARGDEPRAALAIFEQLLRAEHAPSTAWLRATAGAAVAAARAGALDVARRHRQQLDTALAGPVPDVEAATRALLLVSDLHSEGGDDVAAEGSLRRAAVLAPAGLLTASCAHRLGALCARLSRFDEAERHYDAALEGVRAVQGDDDPATGALLDELASVYVRAQRPADAEAALVEAASSLARARPPDSALQAQVLLRLGTFKLTDQRVTQAMLHFHEAYGLLAALLGDTHPLLAVALEKLAAGHLLSNELEHARAFAERALRVAQNAEHPSARLTTAALTTLAAVHASRKDMAAASSCADRAMAALRTAADATPDELAALADNLARLQSHAAQQGKPR